MFTLDEFEFNAEIPSTVPTEKRMVINKNQYQSIKNKKRNKDEKTFDIAPYA